MFTNEIIAEARSWIGTKFKHQGRIKKSENHKGGCDCLGLILGVADNLKAKSKLGVNLSRLDQNNYPKILVSNLLMDQLDQHLERISNFKEGDVILIKINNWPQHLALISSLKPNITIIHSYIQARKVVEQHLPDEWKNNIVSAYRLTKF